MSMRMIKTMLVVGGLATVLMFGAASSAFADLTEVGPVNMNGTGFGNVNTILTVQALGTGMGGTESGCVGLNNEGKQIDGSSACQGMNTGGDEKPPDKFPHNQVFKVSNAFTLAIVFNTDQPGGSSITLDNLVLVLYNANGQVGFTSGNFTKPMVFASTSFETGIGKSGWEFMLDSTQAVRNHFGSKRRARNFLPYDRRHCDASTGSGTRQFAPSRLGFSFNRNRDTSEGRSGVS
jgi:hypothetical protein